MARSGRACIRVGDCRGTIALCFADKPCGTVPFTDRMHLPPPAPMKSKRRFASSGPMPTDEAEDEEFVTEQEVTRLKENDYFGDRSLVGMWTT